MISMLLSEAAIAVQGRRSGADVTFTGCSTDSRLIKHGEMYIALHGERFDGHEFVNKAMEGGARAVMVEQQPDDETCPSIKVCNTRVAMGRLAAHWRRKFDLPLVAITGSNGKTTVKEMLTSILETRAPVLSTKGNLNNEIGVPMTLFGLDARHRYAVIEMGANHPKEIEHLTHIAQPRVAVITQCSPAHLEGFGTIEGVANAKAEIYSGLEKDGIAIINADDDYAELWRNKTHQFRQISFGFADDADVTAENIQHENSGNQTFTLSAFSDRQEITLALPGRHNIANALAAAACSVAIDIPLESIKRGLEQIQCVKGRLQLKTGMHGGRIYDDSYNANPTSLQAGLDVLAECPGRRWLVLGDMGELGEAREKLHESAGEMARQHGVERMFGIGTLTRFAVKSFGEGATHYSSQHELVTALKKDIERDVILLVKGSRAMKMENIVAELIEVD